jgi:hypothetical protein
MKCQSDGCQNEAKNLIWCEKCFDEIGEFVEKEGITSHKEIKNKDKEQNILNVWEVCTCILCGNSGKDFHFILFGIEAHKKDLSRPIIKICCECENDWISTYRI